MYPQTTLGPLVFSVFEAWAAIEGKTKKHLYELMGVGGD